MGQHLHGKEQDVFCGSQYPSSGCPDHRDTGLPRPFTSSVQVIGPDLLGSLNLLEYKHKAILLLPVTAPGYTLPDLSFLLGSSSLNDVLVWFHNFPATFGY